MTKTKRKAAKSSKPKKGAKKRTVILIPGTDAYWQAGYRPDGSHDGMGETKHHRILRIPRFG